MARFYVCQQTIKSGVAMKRIKIHTCSTADSEGYLSGYGRSFFGTIILMHEIRM